LSKRKGETRKSLDVEKVVARNGLQIDSDESVEKEVGTKTKRRGSKTTKMLKKGR